MGDLPKDALEALNAASEAAGEGIELNTDSGSEIDPELSFSSMFNDPEAESDVSSEDETDVEANEALDEEPKEEEQSESDDDSIEYIVADNKKIKIDYSDRGRTKKAYEMAAGMRKFQSDRDKVQKELEAEKASSQETKDNWQKLEDAKHDLPQLLDLITGEQSVLERYVESKIKEKEHLSNLSPSQLESYNKGLDLDKREAEMARREAGMTTQAEKTSQDREKAEMAAQVAMITPIFSKYRFAGQLDNENREHRLDSMIFSEAINNLSAYDQITPELVEKEISSIAGDLRKTINVQADKRVKNKKIVAKKVATKAAQKAVESEQPKSFGLNDLGDFLVNPSKYF